MWPWNPSQRSLKVTGTDTDWPATYDFLLTLHSIHEPISHRLGDKGRFLSKIANFPTPVYLSSPLKGFPLEFGGTDTKDQKTRTMGLLLLSKQFYIRLAVYTQYRRVTDRQTDGRDDCKDRAYITHSVARVKTCYFSQLLSKWRPIHWFVTLLYFSQTSVFFCFILYRAR